MKISKEVKDEKKGCLVQIRLTHKKNQELSPYRAWEMLEAALKDHKELNIYQAEFRVEKDEEQTSI